MTDKPHNDRPPPPRKSPHFFTRELDGSARFRIRLTPELSGLVEEAAGETPLMLYIQRVLRERALYHISKQRDAHPVDMSTPDPDDVMEFDLMPEFVQSVMEVDGHQVAVTGVDGHKKVRVDGRKLGPLDTPKVE